MRHRSFFLATCLAVSLTACSHAKPVVAVPSGPTPAERLAAADDLVRAGCLDCLIDAFREYDALRSMPALPTGAEAAPGSGAGAVRAAALIALRERELGMIDEGYLDRARAILSGNAALQSTYGLVLDIIDAGSRRLEACPSRRPRPGSAASSRIEPHGSISFGRTPTRTRCLPGHGFGSAARRARIARTGTPTGSSRPSSDSKPRPWPFYQVFVCNGADRAAIESLQTQDPRFRETDYWLGMIELGATSPAGMIQLTNARVDLAQQDLARAYAWHPAWPTLMTSLGGLYMTAEDFDSALALYDRQLVLIPGFPDGLLGRVRALSYLGRYEDAIAGATELLQAQASQGEAYYWRAWNQLRVPRLEAAWADVQQAERLWVNGDVSKLRHHRLPAP